MVLESGVVLVGSLITWVKPYIPRIRLRFLVSLLLSHRKSQFVSPIIIDSFLSASVAPVRASIGSKYSNGFLGGLYNDVTKKDPKFPTLALAEIDSISKSRSSQFVIQAFTNIQHYSTSQFISIFVYNIIV